MVVPGGRESSMTTSAADTPSASSVEAFSTHGYVVLPSFLTPDECDALRSEVDVWHDGGLRDASIARCVGGSRNPPDTMEIDMPHHGSLVGHPRLMALLKQLMGEVFAFHHMHSTATIRPSPARSGTMTTSSGRRPRARTRWCMHFTT